MEQFVELCSTYFFKVFIRYVTFHNMNVTMANALYLSGFVMVITNVMINQMKSTVVSVFN